MVGYLFGTFSLVCNLVLELKSWYMIWKDSISSFLSKWMLSKIEICCGYVVGHWKVIASSWNLGWSYVVIFQDVSNYFFFPFPFASPFFVGNSFVVGSSYANIGQNQYYNFKNKNLVTLFLNVSLRKGAWLALKFLINKFVWSIIKNSKY